MPQTYYSAYIVSNEYIASYQLAFIDLLLYDAIRHDLVPSSQTAMNSVPPLPEFAALQNLPVRAVMAHEAQAFTPWLAANLHRLSDAIDIPMRLLKAKAVSETRIADLLARDERDGSVVVIENQLEAADDAHLGQILTYAAAIDARAIVWIATRFDPPYRAALRWLNAKAAPGVGFYAVEVRVVRIGDSAPALIFTVLERPTRGEPSPAAAKSSAPIAVGGFATAFWAAHLDRFPDEGRLSRPVGERCRWRAACVKGVVIAQFVRENAVSVFLRGRYGVPIETAEEALAPFAEKLERRLGVPLRISHRALLAEKTMAINAVDPANSAQISDWLRAQGDDYDAALREVASHAAVSARRQG
jgi:hypothetical protein